MHRANIYGHHLNFNETPADRSGRPALARYGYVFAANRRDFPPEASVAFEKLRESNCRGKSLLGNNGSFVEMKQV